MTNQKITMEVLGVQSDLQAMGRNVSRTSEIMVATLYWVIDRLSDELGDTVKDMQFEVVRAYDKFGTAYPAISIESQTLKRFDDTYNLIKDTSAKLVKEGSIVELIQFIEDTEHDWIGVAKEIMRKD